MSMQRGLTAANASSRPATHTGLLGMLLVIVILRLVILLGWRDGGSAKD